MKRNIILIVSAVLIATMLTSCMGKEKSVSKESGNMVIKWMGAPVSSSGGVIYPPDDNLVSREIGERLGIKLQVVKTNHENDNELNLMFASGEIPDYWFLYPTKFDKMIEEKLVRKIPVSMIQEKAPTYYAYLEQVFPFWKELNAYEDGIMYGLPQGGNEFNELMVVRKDWLDNLNLKMPSSLEEFEQTCIAFSKLDPDKNGKDDTFGFNFSPKTYEADFKFIFSAFGLNANNEWKQKEGHVYSASISDEYKQALKYLNKLYKEKAIHPEITDIKTETANAKFTDGIVGFKTASWTRLLSKYRPNDWYALTFKKNLNAKTEYVAPLKGPNGRDAVFKQLRDIWAYGCVGKDVSDAKLGKILEVVELQMSNMDINNLIWRGKEGVHYNIDNSGMAITTPEYTSAEKQAEDGIKYFIFNCRNEKQKILSYGNDANVIANFQSNWKKEEYLLLPGTVLKTERKLGADIKKTVEEFMFRAICGDTDIDAEWDSYVRRWEEVGGKAAREEAQQVYDRIRK